MNMLPLLLTVLLVHLDTALTDPYYDECNGDDHNRIRSYSQPDGSTDIEICLNSSWSKICADGWTRTHAKVACRELGLPYEAVNNITVSDIYDVCIKLPGCGGTEAHLAECNLGNPVPEEITYGSIASATCKCSNGQVQLWPTTSRPRQAIVQLCVSGEWKTLCWTNKWNIVDANVVCRQLGYLDKWATINKVLLTNFDGVINFNGFIKHPYCNGTETSLADCPLTMGCTNNNNNKRLATTNCLPACQTREVRLVNGSNYREGRVEICIDGRWGTVCSDHQTEKQEIAEAICTELGFPSEDSKPNMSRFGGGNGAIYSCRRNENMTLDCVNASNVNCAHSMDLGVVCKSYQEIFPQQCNMSTISCDPTTSTTPSINAEQSCGNSSTNGALGGIIGILLALLVAIVTGWLCTCIAFRRRNTNYKISEGNLGNTVAGELSSLQRQLDNPVYDGSTTQPHPPANYSSLGPAYELVEANEGAGHSYDIIDHNRRQGRQNIKDKNPRRPEMRNARESGANLLPDNNYNVLDHSGNTGEQDQHLYHVLEQTNPGPNNQEVMGGRDSNPQDYEVPASRVVSKGADQDEGEYSQLKH